MTEIKQVRKRSLRPGPALVLAFVALFVSLGGFGYAAVKLKPNSVKTKSIRDGAVTTGKLSPNAVAPNAANAARLGGAAPGQCQTGWLKASMVIDTSTLTPEQPTAIVPAFDCASKAVDAVQVRRNDVGRYAVDIAGLDTGVAVSSSTGANAVTAASDLKGGVLTLRVWNNNDAAFVDGKTVALVAY
jgi:hypothetical protein